MLHNLLEVPQRPPSTKTTEEGALPRVVCVCRSDVESLLWMGQWVSGSGKFCCHHHCHQWCQRHSATPGSLSPPGAGVWGCTHSWHLLPPGPIWAHLGLGGCIPFGRITVDGI